IFESIKSNRTAEELIEKDENNRVIAYTLTKIKPRYQYVISLSFFLELEDHEIAEIMNIKKQNVHVLLHRALKSFEKKFDKKYFEK
ncbi:sigma-70 family RNA polymerase sigma factor, partial [Candidatus Dojkabacteria bacterium]|nr:sigma-70 family RNA polymerase sigma factor [Candidatus Dojkabacteria bacterium]